MQQRNLSVQPVQYTVQVLEALQEMSSFDFLCLSRCLNLSRRHAGHTRLENIPVVSLDASRIGILIIFHTKFIIAHVHLDKITFRTSTVVYTRYP